MNRIQELLDRRLGAGRALALYLATVAVAFAPLAVADALSGGMS